MKCMIIVVLACFGLVATFAQQKPTRSPMPNKVYDLLAGEGGLINPVKNSLDAELSELCERFAKNDATTRARLRASLTEDDLYTLLVFSKRSSIFAIRERNVGHVINGLRAIAMMQHKRIEPRDILWALSFIHHSARRINQNGDKLLRDASKLSEPKMARLIVEFVEKRPQEKDLRESWGYDEVQTKNGVGFIGWEFEKYDPTYDLKLIVIDIADVVAADKYHPANISVAATLPPVWLETKDNSALNKALSLVRGGASVFGRLRPGVHPEHGAQILMVFLVETADESAARTLLALSKEKKPSEYGMFGLAQGKLFCLIVGRSFVDGVQSIETSESLARFSDGIGKVLANYATKPQGN